MSVSALMVTQPGREALAKLAIADFARQTWLDRELVIVTDSLDANHYDLLRKAIVGVDGARISRAPFRASLGFLRNWAVREARRDVVIQWDDDDRYAPNRIAVQLAPILDSDAAATCLVDQLYYFKNTDDLYLVDWRRRHPRSELIPGTIAVKRSVASRARYPEEGGESQRGEDGAFLRQVTATGRTVGLAPQSGLCYLRQYHGGNTWQEPHFRGNAMWLGLHALPLQELRALIARRVREWGLKLPVRVMGRDHPAFEITADATTLLWDFNSMHGPNPVCLPDNERTAR